MRNFILELHYLFGVIDSRDDWDRLNDRKPLSFKWRLRSFWHDGVRGYTLTCDKCGRNAHVHRYTPGPILHMCYCTEIGNIMSLPRTALKAGYK